MKYLPTAFSQLNFTWKLYKYALDGNIDFNKLDIPIQSPEKELIFGHHNQIFNTNEDLIVAIENILKVSFGVAAITLNKSREESGIPIPKLIKTEIDQFVVLTYQIRNAFAHDISEPCWEIRNPSFLRRYEFGQISVDLTNLHNSHFDYKHIGGLEVLFLIKAYAETNVWPKAKAPLTEHNNSTRFT
ncbi:MAG: hypothetical protein CTY19_05685 [Methylomonas sp.]|nr:MAG: hypothetical protein CTY19_05685 [Methylomonas sp.]